MFYSTEMRFVDTNVLVYAVSPDPGESKKRRIALSLLQEPDLAISTQVLQEFYHQSTRPSRRWSITHEQALGFIESITRFPVLPVTVELFRDAVAISQRFGLSYWDGAILAAARSLGCDAVYSEDLNPEQDYNGLRVINPFAELTRPL